MTDTLFKHHASKSYSKLNCLDQTTLSCALCFFARENKRPITVQSVSGGAALYHRSGTKAAEWRDGSRQQELYDAFESVALLQPQGQRKLPGNSRWIVPPPGWGYNMYIHETEQLIPDCWDKALFHPTAGFRDQRTTGKSPGRCNLELYTSSDLATHQSVCSLGQFVSILSKIFFGFI